MSPLPNPASILFAGFSRDRYVAVLAPGMTSVIRRRGNGSIDLKADQVANGNDALSATEALRTILTREAIGPGRLDVVLSNHFVRYQVLPWRDEIASHDEMTAYAQASFEQVFGADSADWEITVGPEPIGRARLAAALPRRMKTALEELVAATPLRLGSVQPYLASAFNRLCADEKTQSLLFVLVEPRRASLLLRQDDQWQHVRVSAGADNADAITDLITRELSLAGISESGTPAIVVHAPQQAQLKLPTVAGRAPRVAPISIPAALAPVADVRLAMAMTAL